MVSYGELIYQFADIYLKSAVECSVCKENYTMVDDTTFLDEYMKLFVSLLSAVENDDDLCINNVKETLLNKKKEKIAEFRNFLKHEVANQAIEMVQKELKDSKDPVDYPDVYINKISLLFQKVFGEQSDTEIENPVELLRYVRGKEELL